MKAGDIVLSQMDEIILLTKDPFVALHPGGYDAEKFQGIYLEPVKSGYLDQVVFKPGDAWSSFARPTPLSFAVGDLRRGSYDREAQDEPSVFMGIEIPVSLLEDLEDFCEVRSTTIERVVANALHQHMLLEMRGFLKLVED